MAAPSLAAAESLPRFLLPRLSWKATTGPLASSTCRAHSRRHHQPTPRGQPTASFHSASPARPGPRSTVAQGRPSPILSRASFHTTAPRQRDHHFDTLKFVQRLESEGFTEEQAVAMMKVLNDVIEERYDHRPSFIIHPTTPHPQESSAVMSDNPNNSIQNLTRTMVLREDAAKATYTQKVDFAKLRSELLSADSTESNTTRSTHERLSNEIAKLNSRLRDEIGRTQASVRLDLNLEKGRIREEAVGQELKIKETETRIEQEVAALREKLEQVKFQTLQWLMGVCTGFAAVLLGAWRLLM
ncbi:hypothetical protein ACRE_068590 [Hapsidospora chrysogenum ATCC 11550]|uniref:Uncharacterized protein n=1 Tax=Hapsidospora chrysogenum (strain ATCC 11550 / CBS 779.69 / DSM 880 / IAM 14645 / JCM 23072 / IMI 49137) TaxID=857340 RepID=A0A086SZ84_HAPC1|nr:hypothetical protein ACRE_068590 [Hapsidospora chrysogenum ATCC 11550]